MQKTAAQSDGNLAIDSLLKDFIQVREETEFICKALEIEDHVVQPASFVSPPKWHLAHTSWFFDCFILHPRGSKVERTLDYDYLFNSYYKSQGKHWLQENRGSLSRPTVKEILEYRQEVSGEICRLLKSGEYSKKELGLIHIGIQHEKQHQELLLMDIKYIFAKHPQPVAYDAVSLPELIIDAQNDLDWISCAEKDFLFGAKEGSFSYDNERPKHQRRLHNFKLAKRMTNNGEFLGFIEDDGYSRPELWLSDGWDWLNQQHIEHPLYWCQKDGEWFEYHLGGVVKLHLQLPVSHVSYYEADAFARWMGMRLPTEFELEYLISEQETDDIMLSPYWKPNEAICPNPGKAVDSLENGLLWQWSSSAYSPYPGFIGEAGEMAEYNAKFMANQFVLKGGSVASPVDHIRPSYRNFYRASDRWAFTGVRLARNY